MSGATSNERQSVWEFTELRRYCVKLPVCQRPSSSSSRRRLNALGLPRPLTSYHPHFSIETNKRSQLVSTLTGWLLESHLRRDLLGQVRLEEKKYVARVFCPLPPLRAKACGAQKDCTGTFAKPEPRTVRATTSQLLSSYYSLLQSNMLFLICLQ